MRIFLCLIILVGINVWSRPTSNVINAVYSLQDDFFEAYGFPSIPFKDRVTILENPNKSYTINNDSISISAVQRWDKYSLVMFKETEGSQDVDHLYFKLIKDKEKKRYLLAIFNQVVGKYDMRLKRVDVIQYDKKVKGRWKTINAADIIPKITWHDLYQGISDKAFDKIFTVRPAIGVAFQPDGSLRINIVYDYIENELPEVQKYLEENPVDPNSIQFEWNKEKSKYIAKIL